MRCWWIAKPAACCAMKGNSSPSTKWFAQTHTRRRVEVIIQPTEAAAADLTAKILAHDLRASPRLVIGLATGKTMEGVYRELVRRHKEEQLDFSQCTTFNLDEYVGIAASDPHSYHHYMRQHLFDRVNIKPGATHLPNGLAADLDAECGNYEARIEKAGGI